MARVEKYEAGEYTNLMDYFEQREYADTAKKDLIEAVPFEKGDTVELSEAEATRLANANAVAPVDSVAAQVARGEIPAEFAPSSTASVDALERQKEAIEAAIAERQRKYEETSEERDNARSDDELSAPVTGSLGREAEEEEPLVPGSGSRSGKSSGGRGNRSRNKAAGGSGGEGSEA